MVKKSIKKVLFFVVMFALAYLAIDLSSKMKGKKSKLMLFNVLIALVYTGIMFGVYHLSKVEKSKEKFWDISPGARYKGVNWYNCQGDSPEAKECRRMLSTPEGQCQIASYSCPNGFIGSPKIPFQYTELSGSDWKNKRCDDSKPCSCHPRHDDRGRYTAWEKVAPFDTCG